MAKTTITDARVREGMIVQLTPCAEDGALVQAYVDPADVRTGEFDITHANSLADLAGLFVYSFHNP